MEKQTITITIPKKLSEELKAYIRANDIEDENEFLLKIFKQGFTIEKYGMLVSVNHKPQIIEEVELEPVKQPPIKVDTDKKNKDLKKKEVDIYGES